MMGKGQSLMVRVAHGSSVRNSRQRVAARETEHGDRIPEFCTSKTDEEICGVGFSKELRKTY